MFTRAGRDAKKPHPGLGVGLNLARRMVELHGGQILASSEGLGRGSDFLVTLPLAGPADGQAPLAPEAGAAPANAHPVRVLIVDDNLDAASSLSLLLQLGGHTTALAQDGFTALEAVAEFKPDIVLLDLGLPDMTGYEVASAIRARPELGRPFMVAVTGWGGPEDRAKSKEAGFAEHLTKPVDISVIELLLTTLPARQTADGHPPEQNGHEVDASI